MLLGPTCETACAGLVLRVPSPASKAYAMCLFPQNSITPSEVQQWTNHRVMEWLRSVDLAEYAPNLRGSGVHGGLMVRLVQFEIDCSLGWFPLV